MAKAKAEKTFVERHRYEIQDVLERAAKTFVQALTAQLTVAAIMGGDYASTRAALVAAFAAGFSVIWNAATAWANRI